MGYNLGKNSLDKPANSSIAQHQDEQNEVFKIAIIGCGAATVATLFGFIEYFHSGFIKNIKISIFEKEPTFGSGLAYQCDSEELMMNMVSSTISIFPHKESDFWEWILERGCSYSVDQIISKSGVAPEGYISRQFFGAYLRSRLQEAISALEKLGIEVDLIHCEVVNLELLGDDEFNVIDKKQKGQKFNGVILCVGNTSPQDIFNLSGKSQYINNPYPVSRFSPLIKRSDSVGIIGGQLTAADIAVVLANQGHYGPIYFFTRDLNLPLIRRQKNKFHLNYLTIENLRLLQIKNKDGISLRQILRLARKDFLKTGMRWNNIFKSAKTEYSHWIKYLLEDEYTFMLWQHCAIETDFIIAEYWHALTSSEKDLFLRKYHRLWMSKRVPLPVHTALKLHSLFQAGILRHYPFLYEINFLARNRFVAVIKPPEKSTDAHEVVCDWVINATGPSRDVDKHSDSVLISNLFKSGLITANPHGGIALDYETSLIKTRELKALKNFYAIGHLTSGTYYFISSLDMVSLRARSVAKHFFKSLNNKYRPPNSVSQSSIQEENVSQ